MGIFSGSMVRRREVVDPLTVGLLALVLDPVQLATGSPWNDRSGNGRHFTDAGGMATLSSGGPQSDYAADFSAGATGYLSRAWESAMQLHGGDWAISAWYYFPATADGIGFRRRWTSRGSGSSTEPYADSFNVSGAQFGWRCRPTGSSDNMQTAETYTKATWYHIVELHRESSPLNQLWVNGSMIIQNTVSPTSISSHTHPFWIGRSAGTAQNWGGRMARYWIWSRTLDSAEIARLYNSGAGITAAAIGL